MVEQADKLFLEVRAAQPDNADLAYSHANTFLILGMSYMQTENWTDCYDALLRAREVYSKPRFSGADRMMQLNQLATFETMAGGCAAGFKGDADVIVGHFRASLAHVEEM